MEVFEGSKENIQATRSGRKPELLAQLFAQSDDTMVVGKNRFEEERLYV